jgi:hypothetical protein
MVPATLLDVQALDLAIDRLVARERALEGGDDVEAAVREADDLEAVFGELKLQIDALDRDASKLEHEIDSLTQKSDAEKRRMSDGSVANARELESIGREIESLTRRISDREDTALEIMEIREGLAGRVAEAEKASATARESVGRIEAAAAEELSAVRSELDEKRKARADLIGSIDTEVVELYEELRPHKKGVGAAALVDGVCQGCHETLSAVELDRLKRETGVRRCEHCRRILVL